jgi:uncharacterized membrane protein YfcA
MNVGFALAVLFLTFFANFSYAISGFGSSIIFQIGWQLYDLLGVLDAGADFTDGIMNLTLIGVFISAVQSWHLRGRVNVALGVVLATTRAAGQIVGAWILVSLSASGLQLIKQLLGVMFLLIAAHKCFTLGHCNVFPAVHGLWKDQPAQSGAHVQTRSVLSLESTNVRVAVIAAGLASGFLAGLMGTGGPPIMVLLSYYPLPKEEYRATAAAMIVVASSVGAVFMGSVSDRYFSLALVPQYTIMIAGALAGLVAGNMSSRYVSQALFGDIILGLLVAGAALMTLSAGAGPGERLPLFVPLAALCAILIMFVGLCVKIAKSARQQHSVQQHGGQQLQNSFPGSLEGGKLCDGSPCDGSPCEAACDEPYDSISCADIMDAGDGAGDGAEDDTEASRMLGSAATAIQ